MLLKYKITSLYSSTSEKTSSDTRSVIETVYGGLIWVYTKYIGSFYTSGYLWTLLQIDPNLFKI